MLRDSRTMHGTEVGTPDEIRSLWSQWCWSRFQRGPLPSADTVPAFVSDGRWVATCPTCNGGIATWISMSDGCCYDCGTVYAIAFPPLEAAAQAEVLLEARPQQNQNWDPVKEPIEILKAENAVNGVPFVITDDQVAVAAAVLSGSEVL